MRLVESYSARLRATGWRAMAIVWLAALVAGAAARAADVPRGFLPTDEAGRELNFDFESGDLAGWQAEGTAFAGQPVKGDSVHARRPDMHSRHAGLYWVGTYESQGDAPQGTLRSAAFRVTQPFATFLVGGGSQLSTRVEIVRQDNQQVVFQASGDDTEDLQPVLVDLSAHLGQTVFVRLVDHHSGGWGHINFDDFRLHAARPAGTFRPVGSPPLDTIAHAGLGPQAAAQAMRVPEGFTVTLFAGEPDVQQPIAQAIDDRGRLWVAEAYSYPFRVPNDKARDRIVIFEDRDGDGRFDVRTVFAEGLNLVSGLELGFGGVWVGAAPELLFIPDADGDDRPDGPPRVLLDGWGYQDTHETLNTFAWGPDGWLYGCHGVFTHSRVGKPGTPDHERVPLNAGLWRYHPTRHEFELFAEGTSNPWGVDFNDQGQAFVTACVIPHLYHVVQGGRYQRQAGQHFNPYTFDDIKTIARHRHWVGATPHAGNNRSDSAGGGHAHAGAMIYLGGSWPERYRNQLLMNNIHGARLNMDQLAPRGSGYLGDRAPDFLFANDAWSQIINLQYGPDGQMYMIDWYDKNQCHHQQTDGHDRTNGRIFKVSYQGATAARVDLRKLDDRALVDLQLHRNDWYCRHARRILQERGLRDPAARAAAVAMACEHADETRRLRALLLLHVTGALDEDLVARGLANDSALVRAWAVQLATERRAPSPATLARFADLARDDASPVVRLYLASAAGRLPTAARWEILAGLVRHAEDADDHNLPLLYWYAAEPLAAVDAQRALRLAESAAVPPLLSFMARRVAAIGSPDAIALLVRQIADSDQPSVQRAILAGLNEAFAGRRKVDMPDGWPAAQQRITAVGDGQAVAAARLLATTFGDAAATSALRAVVADAQADLAERLAALGALLKVRDPGLASTLQSLLDDRALRGAALRGLAAYDDPHTAVAILAAYSRLDQGEKRDALATLAARVDSSLALLAAVAEKRIAATDLSADLVRQLHNFQHAEIDRQISALWGTVRDTPADKAELITEHKKMLTRKPKTRPDPLLGRAVYAKTCQQCHTLFGVGAAVGPELTGSNRANVEYVLSNVLDPSALVGKDYQATVISTTDGRVLTGLVRGETPTAVTLITATETVVIPQTEIDERTLSAKSMMPDDLLKPLAEHEIRSLVAYLASPEQVPQLATADNVQGFFNGRDLAGWQGSSELWHVEDGQIVGRSAGLARNEFLKSDLAAADFRLTLEVKLIDNQGNSGVQFRSTALPGGEVQGYQADIGAGWWGKLYEEHGRGLLASESGEKHVKPGDWNTYQIEAIGNRLRTWINGRPCVDLEDANAPPRGIFALQLHSGGATEVRFRNLRLELDPRPQPSGAGN